MTDIVKNYINGKFVPSASKETSDIINPATCELLGRTPVGCAEDVDDAVKAATAAFPKWRDTPVADRIQYLFRLRGILERDQKEMAELVTREHGKTYNEGLAEIRRAIQDIETACGMPNLSMGEHKTDVAKGIDCIVERRPLGIFAGIVPFNFPAMVSYWFWPFAVAAGNTYIIKPSEIVPLSQTRMMKAIEEAGFPAGVVNLVQGGKVAVDAILKHPNIKGVSFVGSSTVAKYIYQTGNAHGKRVQALGGAKNCLIILPDAPFEKSVRAMVDSCFGCAGQRCLAGSVLIGVGGAYDKMKELVIKYAKEIVVGDGMDPKVTMGPVATASAKTRILNDIETCIKEGAELLLDGRNVKVQGDPKGHFIGPTVFNKVKPSTTLTTKEIFGPVIGLMKMENLDDAINFVNSSNYGNTTSLFTSNGAAARYFINKVEPGMIGVNLGVPAPMSFFGFGGSKDSFYGDIKGQVPAVRFFTEEHITMVRWFDDSREEFVSPHWGK